MTVGVMGCAKGGTSLISGIARVLGMPCWGSYKSNDDHYLLNNITKPSFRSVVQRRNAYGEWMFKHPDLWQFKDELDKELTNPRYIYVFRDPVAVCSHRGLSPKIEDLIRCQSMYSGFLQQDDGIFVSFERALKAPQHHVKLIADFIGYPFKQEAVDYFSSSYNDCRNYIQACESHEKGKGQLVFTRHPLTM